MLLAPGTKNLLHSTCALAALTISSNAYSDNNSPINIGNVSQSSAETSSTNAKKIVARLLRSNTPSTYISAAKIANEVAPGGTIVDALTVAPGVHINGYGSGNGAARYQIRINGIQTGWALSAGNPEKNGIAVSFDGVPMNNPLSNWDGWESSETPISNIFSGIRVTQGPGNPDNRWYDSMGGTVNLIPQEPGKHMGGEVALGYGSFSSPSAAAVFRTGDLSGWSTVFAAGYTRSNGFRSDPYYAPNEGAAFYMKTRKDFTGGHASVGLYFSRTSEYRPMYIPVSPIPGVSVNGYQQPGPAYSEQTTGYTYTIPTSLYFKNDTAHMFLGYAKLHLRLASNIHMDNLLWYRNGYRHHNRPNNYYFHLVNTEDFTNTTATLGDKLVLSAALPWNHLQVGGYIMDERNHNTYLGYNPAVFASSPANPIFVAGYYDDWEGANIFTQDTITPLAGLHITPGLALMSYRVQFVNNSNATIPVGATPYIVRNLAANNVSNYTKLIPSLGINYRVLQGLHLFSTWSQNFQTPSADAYGNYDQATVVVPRNPTSINSYIGGVKWDIGPWDGTVSAFHQHLTNAVLSSFIPSLLITELDQVSAIYNGVNFSANYGKRLGVQLFTNDTLEHAYYPTYRPASGMPLYGARMPNVPTTSLSFGVGYRWYQIAALWNARLSDTYTSSTTLFSNITNEPTNAQNPAYNIVDLGLSVTTAMHLVPGFHKIKFSLQIFNLFNRHYNSMAYISSGGELGPNSAGAVLADPGAPRAVYGSLTAYL
ncbi:TonB-dependent receptor [Acidithiobacillus ferrianus]|uniref:TonB-dependent receptor n=1 Tax=Acidithiobacillus ferrianus TaxID=2678518 RepID=UPI0034E5E3B6